MRLVYLALGWVAGIVLAASTPALIPVFWAVLLSAFVLALWFGWDTRYRWLLLAGLAFALAGYRFAFVPQTSDIARYNNQNVTLQGQIIAPPDRRDDRVQMRVQVEQVTAAAGTFYSEGLVLVGAPRVVDVSYGDTIRATGPLMTPGEFDTFSYADYLARSGVFSVMRGAAVDVVETGDGSPLLHELLRLKEQVRQNIALALPEPQAGLLTGILLGNERGIAPELADDFSRVGASHIIAISGFNMVIVAGLVMGLLGRTPLSPGWKVTLSVLVLAIYTVFVGANAAVVRAALMSSLLIIAPLLRRKTFLPASLAFVVIAMSLHQPLVLWNLSFQLSFFAVLGLALFTEPLTRRFDALLKWLLPPGWARTTGHFLNEPLIVTLAALSMTLPLTVLYFQKLSVVALLVNLLIVPVQSYLLIVGGLAALLSLVAPGLAQLFFWLDMVLLSWSIAVVRFFADWPFADIDLTLDPRLIATFYAVIMGGAMMQATRPRWLLRAGGFLRRRPVLNAVLFSGGALLLLLLAMVSSRPDGKLHVWFLDVGHSNAVLVQTPGGAQILVDGGRYPSRLLTAIGDRLPFYDRELELVVITHPDDFDTAALPALFSRYRAGAVLVNGQTTQSDSADTLREAIARLMSSKPERVTRLSWMMAYCLRYCIQRSALNLVRRRVKERFCCA